MFRSFLMNPSKLKSNAFSSNFIDMPRIFIVINRKFYLPDLDMNFHLCFCVQKGTSLLDNLVSKCVERKFLQWWRFIQKQLEFLVEQRFYDVQHWHFFSSYTELILGSSCHIYLLFFTYIKFCKLRETKLCFYRSN